MRQTVSSYIIILIKAHFVDFWQYTSTYREQPQVHFINQWILQVTTDRSSVAKVWSTFIGLNRLLQDDTLTPLNSEIAIPIVKVHNCINILYLYE